MKLIVGLGNPGARYSRTRHNVGRMAVESFAKHRRVSFSHEKSLDIFLGKWQEKSEEVLLAYPNVFMNVSGVVVKRLADGFAIDPEKDLLVVVDDAALPLGRLRLRAQGSDGGHNGLKSIEHEIGTLQYARLRLGIGTATSGTPSETDPLEHFVLSDFESQEQAALHEIFQKTEKACELWIQGPIEAAMNIVNA